MHDLAQEVIERILAAFMATLMLLPFTWLASLMEEHTTTHLSPGMYAAAAILLWLLFHDYAYTVEVERISPSNQVGLLLNFLMLGGLVVGLVLRQRLGWPPSTPWLIALLGLAMAGLLGWLRRLAPSRARQLQRA